MTQKRFRVINHDDYELDYITDNNKRMHIEDVCDLLNELHEENTMLKERRHEDINELSVIAMKYKALENENEQLKKDNTNLHRAMSKDRVNYLKFRDKVFDLIDKKIKEVDTIGAEVLKDLRKELIE